MTWVPLDHLSDSDFKDYLNTIPEDNKPTELQQHMKLKSEGILKEEMKKYTNFYNFIKKYSPNDFKTIKNKGHVSQRVLTKHLKFWNEIHPSNQVKNLRVFFY